MYALVLFGLPLLGKSSIICHPNLGERFEVTIYNNDMLVYQNQVTYGKSFADVRIGQPILYINSLYRVGLAINQGSFAKAYNVGVGASWHIEIKNGKLTGDIRMKQKSLFSTKDVVAIGVGAALFVVGLLCCKSLHLHRIRAFSCNMPFKPL